MGQGFFGFADHVPETEEYGVASYVYRARRPSIPEKIMTVLNGEMPGVIRAKGHFWIATRPDWVAEFSLAGALSSVKPLGMKARGVPSFFATRLVQLPSLCREVSTHIWRGSWDQVTHRTPLRAPLPNS